MFFEIIVPIILKLIVLHAPDGDEIDVNPEQITAIRDKKSEEDNKFVVGTVNCILNTSDGKFVSVVESCEEVRRLIREAEEKE